MFDRIVAATAACAVVIAHGVAAQSVPPGVRERALLQRVSVLFDSIRVARNEQRARTHQPQAVEHDGLRAVVVNAAPAAAVQAVLTETSRLLRELDVVPESLARAVVLVQFGVLDTTATMRTLAQPRRAVRVEWPEPYDTAGLAALWADVFGRLYHERLDSTWTNYLSWNLGFGWTRDVEGAWALRELAVTTETHGRECLAGVVAGCRLWLALDNDPHPFRTRYTPADLRAHLSPYEYQYNPNPSRVACRQGDDAACVTYYENLAALQTVPASEIARRSLLRFLHDRRGAAAERAALEDTRGSRGERLARAAGVSEDSLVTEWRAWVLSRGRPERVSAGLADVMPVVLTVGLLAFAVSRGGRWR